MISVLIVDDHRMFAESLRRLLGDEPDMQVVATAYTGEEAESFVAGSLVTGSKDAAARANVCVLDYQLPDADGATIARRLRALDRELHIVVLTGLGRPSEAQAALSAGCEAFVTKDRAASDLVKTLRAVAAGEPSIGEAVDTAVRDRAAAASRRGITPRELEVLHLLADGSSNHDIADRLFVARNTVRTHVQRVIAKLDAHSKLEAVATARAEHLI